MGLINLFNFVSHVHSVKGQWILLFISLLLLAPLAIYTVTSLVFKIRKANKADTRVPPTIPYTLPIIGHALRFVLDPARVLNSAMRQVQLQIPFRLKIFNTGFYFIQGTDNINAIWKLGSKLSGPDVQILCLRNAFNMPPKAVNMYVLDNSGIQNKPIMGSNVAEHNRIDYIIHKSIHKFLSGAELFRLEKRWKNHFESQFRSLPLTTEWTTEPDIMHYFLIPMVTSLTETIAGPVLRQVNPDFVSEFLKFWPMIHDLLKRLPRWWIPSSYQRRDDLLRIVKQWHAISRANFQESDVEEDGDADPWWGSEFIRERQRKLSLVDSYDHDAIASNDLGLLWGMNANVNPSAIWCIIEIFKDPGLLCRVRAEVDDCYDESKQMFNDDNIMVQPTLQSVYSEILRLYTVTYTLGSTKTDTSINGWIIPKGNSVLIPTAWNTQNGQYPLNKFWADRFLIYPNDVQSGPQKYRTNTSSAEPGSTEYKVMNSSNKPSFSTDGMGASYIPFGIGPRQCPGRHFAKRMILQSIAMIVNDFDIEVLVDADKIIKTDPRYYGLGTQRPKNPLPFKIRRRSGRSRHVL